MPDQKTLKVLAISGSLRQESFNTKALKAAASLAPDGVEVEFADLSEIPLYDQDVRDTSVPAAAEKLQQQILAADALLIASPEYNFSISGVLKNAIDWMSRLDPMPFADKPGAILGASMGKLGTARAQYDLRKILNALNMHLINKPEVMLSGAHTLFDDDGNLTDEDTQKFLTTMMEALATWTRRLQ